MKYGSVCSGVEAATVAWHPLGWEPQWFSEIEKFPSEVLQHHYPDVPNLGDMTKFKEWPSDRSIDLLVGGTPCQSFSVAGLRKGLDDPRGNLMLTYLAIAAQYQPQWLVWENVPGVLSSNRGRDFGTFLGALGKLGYGFAYRVLDAQYFGVAQRRRRVFVVGYLGDWRRAAAVLFERESMSGHPAPSREARQETTGYTESSFGNYSEGVGTVRAAGGTIGGGSETLVTNQAHTPATAGALDTQCGGGKLTHQSAKNGHLIVERDVIGTLTARGLNAIGARDVEEGVIHPVAFPAEMSGTQAASTPELSPTLSVGHTTAVAYGWNNEFNGAKELMPTIKRGGQGGSQDGVMQRDMKVRRLTPIECERLQGFPDNYTQIAWRNKAPEDCPDGPRYKAMGNSMAVPVMRWIGERIDLVNKIQLPDTGNTQ